MKFAHMADCHIGSWREPKLKEISINAFARAVDLCIEKNVDFILIAGDLFNTSLPSVDSLKEATKKLKELKDRGIAVYIIPGSHDFSPSGKTMLDVLENAGLCINVAKVKEVEGRLKLGFVVDEKTGAKITGLLGKKGGLEKGHYESLDKENLEKEGGFKIFMFHSLLTELKPKELEKAESQPLSLLPKNFSYYAGGHPHFVFEKDVEGYGKISYPGPLFPNNFRELEKLNRGGFYFVDVDDKVSLEWQPIQVYNVHPINIDCEGKTPEKVNQEIIDEIKGKEFNDTIVTIRLEGMLDSGKPSDIDFKDIFKQLHDKSAYSVMKNTAKLTSKELEELKVDKKTADEIEESLIDEHLGQIKVEGIDAGKEREITKMLMDVLGQERTDEKVADFERRIMGELNKVLEL